MALYLFRLGRWSFLHRKVVASVWVLLLVLLAVGSATLSGKTNDNFQLSGIESTQAFDLIKERSPQASPDGATARVVFEAPKGSAVTEPTYKSAIGDALAAVKTRDVASIADPFTSGAVSQDGRVAYATVSFTKQAVELTQADKDALAQAKETASDAGLNVAIGGDALQAETSPPTAEAIGIVVAFVVLTLTFGSLVAAGMPLITAIVGVGIGFLTISVLTGFIELSSTTPALGTMLGLAVGIDYALFIMSRYQHEVRRGRSLEDAAGRAVGTAGSAVVFAGLTVIIALVGLAVCGIGFLTQMGLAAAFIVALAVLIALTLLPAILGFAGHQPAAVGPGDHRGRREQRGAEEGQHEDRVHDRLVHLVQGVDERPVVGAGQPGHDAAGPDVVGARLQAGGDGGEERDEGAEGHAASPAGAGVRRHRHGPRRHTRSSTLGAWTACRRCWRGRGLAARSWCAA
jgi:putative drug exporter of the RND superfamily